MSSNPLVAGRVDTSAAFGGAGLLESVSDLCSSLESGSWVSAGLAGLGVALDTAAAVVDPLGSLIGAGLGWLMEHLEPLKGWLNDLTGDAGAVLGFAGTWQNVADAMGAAGDELTRIVRADLEAMSGESIAAYSAYAAGLADRIRTTGGSASAIGGALKTCAMVVQVVHDLVRDTLAQLVGSIISWAAEAVFTLGLATPVIVGQVTTRVSSLATRVGRSVTDVIASAKSLKRLLEALQDVLRRMASGVRAKLPGAKAADAPGLLDRLFHTPEAADLNRFPVPERINRYFERVAPKDGFYDVGLHGNPNSVFLRAADGTDVAVDHRVLADLIRRQPDYDGGPVRLLSCRTGARDDGLAQRLADSLGEIVEAPSDTLWIWPNGKIGIGPSDSDLSGVWRSFTPGKGAR
ncbi:hypothetical protein [Cellulomonas sp. URHD0024]|uniref:hypothetical protein n=1 Tax=Cellulomonas sp. URHD0024 TaxID=1302620 RepID=UPI0012DC3942|nr:hypothetical protein [Cellulomonas sp. URHD0024]